MVITMWKYICNLSEQKPTYIQRTFCYCDCGNELVSNHKSVSENDGVVEYICGKCGKTVWLFNAAPAPIRIEQQNDCTKEEI